MLTTQDPSHCPRYQSQNIYLGQKVYMKNVWGEDTDAVVLGM